MKSSLRLISRSPSETRQIGVVLAKVLRRGDVVVFLANLGAGKTTLTQGVIHGLGSPDEGSSPTFVIAQTFKGRFPVHHLDFYRLNVKEILSLGLHDYILGQGEIEKGVVLIEWAERCKAIWPKERLEVRIRPKQKGNVRTIILTGYGSHFKTIISKVKTRYEK